MNNKKLVIGIITMFFIGVTGLIYSLGAVKEPEEDVMLTKDAKREDTVTDQLKRNSKNNVSSEEEDSNVSDFKDVSREEAVSTGTDEEKENTLIYVHVCGEVKNPNVYSLEEGTRVIDAVKKAGGFTKAAAKNYINQARVVVDGEQLYIPSKDEVQDMNILEGKGLDKAGESPAKSTLVNINIASMEDLMTLPGIGESKAKSIITYREENGTFKSIEELKNIVGIKEGVYQKISDLITVN